MTADSADSASKIHFEVHALHQDRWLIDCTSKSPEHAIHDAKSVLAEADVWGVKVIKEVWQPRTNLVAGRVIFSQMKNEPATRPGVRTKVQVRAAAPAQPKAPLPTAEPQGPAGPPASVRQTKAMPAFAVFSIGGALLATGAVLWLSLG